MIDFWPDEVKIEMSNTYIDVAHLYQQTMLYAESKKHY